MVYLGIFGCIWVKSHAESRDGKYIVLGFGVCRQESNKYSFSFEASMLTILLENRYCRSSNLRLNLSTTVFYVCHLLHHFIKRGGRVRSIKIV